MEYHPEEDNYSKNQEQCNDTLFGLSGSKFRSLSRNRFRFTLLLISDNMTISATTREIDNKANNQRTASEHKRIAATTREGSDILRSESFSSSRFMRDKSLKAMEIFDIELR